MSDRRMAYEAGTVAWPPRRTVLAGMISRPLRHWLATRKLRAELAALSPRLREDAGLPPGDLPVDILATLGRMRFDR